MSSVKLVSISKPCIEGINTAEDLVAYVARVSNPSNQLNTETSAKLLKYLIKNQHWSPLELVHVVMEINTTRDIGRQILRHRSFVFSEFSQRYAAPTDLGFETKEARMQDSKNRQNSIVTNDTQLQNLWEDYQQQIIQVAQDAYGWAIEQGIAKEQARAVLPEGMTKSRMYMAGSLRSWLHYVKLRQSNGTQKEHREIAIEVKNILCKEFPSLESYFNE